MVLVSRVQRRVLDVQPISLEGVHSDSDINSDLDDSDADPDFASVRALDKVIC